VRRLIINADDLGLTAGVNRAIMEAHTGGAVTSATLMANGAAFDDAVERARSAASLSVGCHVVLVDGAPVSEPDSVPTLLANGSAARAGFYSRLSAFAARAVFGGFDHEQLVGEIVAQVRKIQAAGVAVTHLDTHKHTHIFPAILAALIKAARICGIGAIRNPVVPAQAMRIRQLAGHPGLWKRYTQVRMLRGFAPHIPRSMKRAGLATPDGVVGVVETGSFDGSLLRRMLENLPEGTWELVTHPGYHDAELGRVRTRLLGSREDERRLLMSRALGEFLRAQGFQLTSYRDLVAQL
jgi:hopanoid biosynthesis associated protein HpnK